MGIEQTNGFQSFRTRGVIEEDGQVFLALEMQCFHGMGAFEAHCSKGSALKLSHPPVCSVFRVLCLFRNTTQSLTKGGWEILKLFVK